MKKVNLLDNILDHTRDGVLVLDLNGTILSANEPARNLLDFHESDLINKTYTDVFSEKTRHGAFVHILDEALHKNLECHLKEINYYNSADELVTIIVSVSLLSDKDFIGRIAKKKSLVVFVKPSRKSTNIGITVSDVEAYNQLQTELETVKEKNRELTKILSKFEFLKLAIAVFIFSIFLVLIFYSKNSIKILPTKGVADERQKVREEYVLARNDTMVIETDISGVIEPFSKVTIAAQTSGKVVKRNFQEGDYVPKGHILYQMDTKELAKNVRSARVKYMELLDEYTQLKDWENSLEVMQADRKYELSKISLNNERKKLEETKKLFEKGIIPRVEYDQALTSFKKTEYDYENEKQTLESKIDKGSPEKLEMLKLKLSNAKEELDEVEDRYEATLIRTDVAGIVMLPELENGKTGIFKDEGEMVNDGDLVATIGATEAYIINSVVGEMSVKKIKTGQKVLISGRGFQDVKLEGRVDWIASNATVDENYRYFPIRISIKGVPDSIRQEIRMGMYADAAILIDRLTDVVTVPVDALSQQDGQDVVFVKLDDDNFQVRPVKVGYSDLYKIVIKNGVEAGELVSIGSVNEKAL